MADSDFFRFLVMDAKLCDRTAECGLCSSQIMAGALDGQGAELKLLNHEGTFGVGYGVAVFAVTDPDENRRFAVRYQTAERVRLSLETCVHTGKHLDSLLVGLPNEMTNHAAGAFVSLHIHNQLRDFCIGTAGPTTESAAWEIPAHFLPLTFHDIHILEFRSDFGLNT